ncbi:helix-turn-helix domain-containing protein [Euzebya sp.]|uniref:helix-turn-helix domain-containing protein n=1 Tax=Euzebya sp. TaxID=1971409 RepID=UPI003512DDD2
MERTFTIRTGQDLGAALAEIRRDAGLTQQEFAERVGVSRSYLSKVETGRTTRLIEHLFTALRRAGATVTVTWTS